MRRGSSAAQVNVGGSECRITDARCPDWSTLPVRDDAESEESDKAIAEALEELKRLKAELAELSKKQVEA